MRRIRDAAAASRRPAAAGPFARSARKWRTSSGVGRVPITSSVDPPQILLIAAKRRGDNIQAFELRVDQGIDEIVLRQLVGLLELAI